MSAKIKDKDRAWKALRKELKSIKKSRAQVGYFGGEITQIAAANEFGTETVDGEEHVPERPFLRATADDPKTGTALGKAVEKRLKSKGSWLEALEAASIEMVGLVRKKINTNIPPANDPKTIEAKGSKRTLIDTGRLRQSVTHKIK